MNISIKSIAQRFHSTDFGSNGMTRKPDGNNGASSANDSSMGAKTSWAQEPTAFSSTPLHNCQFRFKKINVRKSTNKNFQLVRILKSISH